ncbi:CB1 cannabinoid receptor-interacting protein 1 [Aplysia californica]|uniref:CB1 cannabinoid receptor-interacting protein 1 n=1 Tax=Aplysia californica TaxID=6500 RepID=A0ABM0ZW28_APLCA|nr:CB1 cannabinoid receptor-interacting protein 1 [Aplysia californica]XP_012935735.1 CB1 cannabinoid receptor-interacting protein 1 [Aplysia californica]XP_035824648.1 CB1 cannabinoid receptor-interacting protein 1 [Aplysia californica]
MTTNSNFKLQISLRRAADDAPVFQKQDGERFDNSITVKLNANTKYSVFLTTRPAKAIQRVILKGEKLPIDRQKAERNEDNCCVYHSEWTTSGMEITKSNLRNYLPMVIEMQDGASVDANLQVKIYPEKENTHCKWGQEFHMLDLDCTQKSGQTAIDVRKQQYI